MILAVASVIIRTTVSTIRIITANTITKKLFFSLLLLQSLLAPMCTQAFVTRAAGVQVSRNKGYLLRVPIRECL